MAIVRKICIIQIPVLMHDFHYHYITLDKMHGKCIIKIPILMSDFLHRYITLILSITALFHMITLRFRSVKYIS